MSKLPKEIREIYDNWEEIKNSALNRYAYYGCCYGQTKNDYLNMANRPCFARLRQQLAGRQENHKHMHYMLTLYPDMFDYKALMKELSTMFKGYFTIKMYKPRGEKDLAVIRFRERKKYLDMRFRDACYTLAFVLIREIGREFNYNWISIFKDKKQKKIDNWHDVIYTLYTNSLRRGHNTNDRFSDIASSIYARRHENTGQTKKLRKKFKEMLDDFFRVITAVCGEVRYNQEDVPHHNYLPQTAAFNYMKDLLERIEENE